jgi:hypothetical protein
MSYQSPKLPSDPYAWQHQQLVDRHIVRTMESGGVGVDQPDITDKQRRRFQRIELLKMLALSIGIIVFIGVGLFIIGLVTGH